MTAFTPEQLDAVTTTAPHVLVLAPAGSGKTRVLIGRLLHLMRQAGVAPTEIMGLTFTRRAAGEMRERLNESYGGGEAADDILNDLTIGTVHSICKRIIETYADRLGYAVGRDLRILDEDDAEMLLVDVAEGLQIARDGRWQRGLSLKQAQAALDAQYAGAEANKDERDARDERLLRTVINEFHARCRELHVLTFGLILSECRRLFDENPDVLETLRQRYRYILVDECQDSSSVEFSLYEVLGAEASTFLVGDLRQAIYSFRFARPDMLKTWISERQPEIHDLRRCFRCGDAIVQAANRLIAHNAADPGEPMIGETKRVGSIASYGGPTEHVVGLIRNLRDDSMYAWGDIAIIARKHSVLQRVADDLAENDIPYQRVGAGSAASNSREFLTLNAAVRLVADPDDRLAYLRLAMALGVDRSERRSIAFESARHATREWYVFLKRATVRQQAVTNLIQSVVPSEVDRNWLADLGHAIQLMTRAQMSWATNAMYAMWDKGGTVADLAATVAVRRGERGEDYRRENRVTLLTAHAAKGLEWPAVIVAEVNDGIFPSAMSLREDGGLGEERRVLYVAITRARETLVLHYQTEEDQRAAEARQVRAPSRFIEECGLNAIREDVVA